MKHMQEVIILVVIILCLTAVTIVSMFTGAWAAEPTSTRLGPYTFPLDEQGRLVIDGQHIERKHLGMMTQDPKSPGICLMVCSSLKLGVPIPDNALWNKWCFET